MATIVDTAMGTFGTIFDIGHALGPILAGLLLAHLNYQHSFLIIATILVLASFVFDFSVQEKTPVSVKEV